jgi:hypothetical protein
VYSVHGLEIGIAANYPGDKGIDKDAAVVFSENFERSSVSEVAEHWTSISDDEGMSLVEDVSSSSSGKKSILFTSINGTRSGGRLYQRFSPGFDQLYLRYYVKYASDPTYYHHSGGTITGCSQPGSTCGGNAGEKPDGTYFHAGFEPNYEFDQPASGLRMDFYVYWMGMREGSSGSYWGNTFVQDPKVKVDFEQWNCIEIMLKINNPASGSNGELAAWLNGEKIIHLGPGYPKGAWFSGNDFLRDSTGTPFEGFQWRNIENLKTNIIKIQHYVEDGEEPEGHLGKLWFDDLVVATQYIGPVFPTTPNITVGPSLHPFKNRNPAIRKLIGKGSSLKIIIEKHSPRGSVEYYSLCGDRMHWPYR